MNLKAGSKVTERPAEDATDVSTNKLQHQIYDINALAVNDNIPMTWNKTATGVHPVYVYKHKTCLDGRRVRATECIDSQLGLKAGLSQHNTLQRNNMMVQ